MIESILAFPLKMGAGNTSYTKDLYAGLGRLGVSVSSYNRYLRRPPAAQCFHFHWPDRVMGGLGRHSPLMCDWAIDGFKRTIAAYRRAGRPVFWTVHNNRPHDFRSPGNGAKYDALMEAITGSINGFIFLNAPSQADFLSRTPQVDPAACIVIRHMLPEYEGIDVQPPAEVAHILSAGRMFLVPGQIRTHKAIERAIDLYRLIRLNDDVLCIAGPPSDQNYLKTIRAHAAGDPRIVILPRALSEGEMLFLYDRATAVFALNAGSKNSGVLFTALARGRRTIVDRGLVSREIESLTGGDAVIYADDSPEAILNRIQAPRPRLVVPTELSLDQISRRYLDFFSDVADSLPRASAGSPLRNVS